MANWIISADEAGGRLDAWLAKRPEVASRARAREWLARGKVFLNDAELTAADAGRRASAGDRVRLWEDRPGSARRADRDVARARHELHVVFEDRVVLVADKPPGLLVEPLPDGAPAEVTLRDLVADHLRTTPRACAFVVHRIDRDTSGLVLFAKNREAQDALKRQFERRRAERIYLAVLRGSVRPAEGVWTDNLKWDKDRLIQIRAHPREAQGRQAVSRYRVLEQFVTAALVEVALVTGKRNQIRVQAGLRGHPVVGEKLYGFGHRPVAGQPTLNRQALHAHRLSFTHPTTNERVRLTAPPPKDLERLVRHLRRGT